MLIKGVARYSEGCLGPEVREDWYCGKNLEVFSVCMETEVIGLKFHRSNV